MNKASSLEARALVQVATLADIPVGGCTVVALEGRRPLALFNVDGVIHALDNECLHSGGPLGRGTLDGCIVTCPWHEWRFDVSTGECVGVTMNGRVRSYPVEIQGDAVLVDLG